MYLLGPCGNNSRLNTQRGVHRCTGSAKNKIWPDNWTCVTKDGGRCAQFEHTILVTPNGHEILTLP